MNLRLWSLLAVVSIGCGPATVGEPCDSPEDSGDMPACTGYAECIREPDSSDFRCAAPCEAGVEGCSRERCDDFCVPTSCESTADCPFGTVCDGGCVVVFD